MISDTWIKTAYSNLNLARRIKYVRLHQIMSILLFVLYFIV